jgi:DNA invertase Pin-like site-specific DNA recombinase
MKHERSITKVWNADIYIRISKENSEDTLENQFTAIAEHLNTIGSILINSVRVDEGYSGLHSNRPAFQETLGRIQRGEIDCVAVRDLSRLSRNYLEAGRYIQEFFPAHGIRFISVFEGFDFTKAPEYSILMMIGFRNLVNEEYSRSLSQSVISALSQGYANGKYMGAFPVYGYKKSPDDRHRLVPDPVPAKVAQDIFQWISEHIPSIKLSHINCIRKQKMAKELLKLRDDLELSRKCFRGLYDEFALRIYTDPDLNSMRMHYKQKCDILEEVIKQIEANRTDNQGTEPILDWITLYKPFFYFEEITRPLLAYLVRRITVDVDKEVKVEFLHDREFELIWAFIDHE